MTANFFAHGKEYEITETGYFILDKIKNAELKSGDVGYVVAGVRDMSHIQPGDTITTRESKALIPLSGYRSKTNGFFRTLPCRYRSIQST